MNYVPQYFKNQTLDRLSKQLNTNITVEWDISQQAFIVSATKIFDKPRYAAMYYEEKIDTDVSRISSMIEPMLVLLMGLLVGGTIIVMYLPIFYMSSVV